MSIFPFLASCGVLTDDTADFFLDCRGSETVIATAETTTEKWRSAYRVSEAEQRLFRLDDGTAIELCPDSDCRRKVFSNQSIELEWTNSYRDLGAKELLQIDRFDGTLNHETQDFWQGKLPGTLVREGTCAKSLEKPTPVL
jgi:hypothetical protein